MYLIVIGSEYAGKTTLITSVAKWLEQQMGQSEFGAYMVHDHFVRPFREGDTEEAKQEAEYVAGMPPKLLEKYSRYMIDYHFGFFHDDSNLLVNWYYGDAVYAPLYYGFGGKGQYADREMMASWLDRKVMNDAPTTTLVLMKAAPEVIRERKRQSPHPDCIVQDGDIERILERFEELFTASGIRRKFTLDTTDSTPESTMAEFLKKVEPNFTDRDLQRMLVHRQVMQS
jgi:thymidylate kinase